MGIFCENLRSDNKSSIMSKSNYQRNVKWELAESRTARMDLQRVI
jgi:hypothetical protein